MQTQKKLMLWINLIGGMAVIGSYIIGLGSFPGGVNAFWGQTPLIIRMISTANMPLAAIGYFAFTFFLLFRMDTAKARIGKKMGFGLFNMLYLGILIPSALWMPLTYAIVVRHSVWLWSLDVIVLMIVGLASLGMLAALLGLDSKRPAWAYWLAVICTLPFIVQTVFMDAILWTIYFPG